MDIEFQNVPDSDKVEVLKENVSVLLYWRNGCVRKFFENADGFDCFEAHFDKKSGRVIIGSQTCRSIGSIAADFDYRFAQISPVSYNVSGEMVVNIVRIKNGEELTPNGKMRFIPIFPYDIQTSTYDLEWEYVEIQREISEIKERIQNCTIDDGYPRLIDINVEEIQKIIQPYANRFTRATDAQKDLLIRYIGDSDDRLAILKKLKREQAQILIAVCRDKIVDVLEKESIPFKEKCKSRIATLEKAMEKIRARIDDTDEETNELKTIRDYRRESFRSVRIDNSKSNEKSSEVNSHVEKTVKNNGQTEDEIDTVKLIEENLDNNGLNGEEIRHNVIMGALILFLFFGSCAYLFLRKNINFYKMRNS